MVELFTIASQWDSEDLSEEDRSALKSCIQTLVGYPCKLACKANTGAVDIYIFSIRKNKVVDWIELQSTGAVGVSFDMYENPESNAVNRLEDACEAYNDTHGFVFEEEEDGESEEEEEEEEEEEKK